MVKHLEEKLSKSKGPDTVKASDERQRVGRKDTSRRNYMQITGKARDEEKIHQEEIIQILKSEYFELKRELEEKRKLVQGLKQELANARISVECVSSKADSAKNMLNKAKRELKEERELVQLLKQKFEETRQSAMRQTEEKELELAINASMAAAEAESRAIAAKVCVICLNNENDTAFGCGHTTCRDCGSEICVCPICREPITSRLRLFLW